MTKYPDDNVQQPMKRILRHEGEAQPAFSSRGGPGKPARLWGLAEDTKRFCGKRSDVAVTLSKGEAWNSRS